MRADGSGRADDVAGRDPVQRLLARSYARIGSRGTLLAVIACGWGIIVITAAVTVAWLARYLRASVGHALLVGGVAEGLGLIGLAVGLALSRDTLATVADWSRRPHTEARAVQTWPLVERLPFLAVTRIATAIFVLECAALTPVGVLSLDTPAYTAILFVLVIATAVVPTCLFVIFGIDLVFRPLLEEVAAHLPDDYVPETASWRLRTKAISAVPGVTLFTAMTVGAFADATDNRSAQLALTIGVAFAMTGIATLLLFVVTRATLDPLDELTAATRRVRDGDLETEVPLLSTDDLGGLTVGFNRMLAGLREREHYREELQSSRARIVAAADAERRRVERDLHDGAQQHLVLLQLQLGLLERRTDGDPELATQVSELRAGLARALDELRDLAHGIYPQVLGSDGLPAALRDAAQRAALPTEVACDGAGRYRPELETAIYFCCLEALQNAGKHAGEGATATIRIAEHDGMLEFEIADTGRGFDAGTAAHSSGLQNMTDRIGALGGVLEVTSNPGAGTVIAGTVPISAGT